MPGQQKGKISATAEIILKGVERSAEIYNKALKAMDRTTKGSAQVMGQSFDKIAAGSQSFFSKMTTGWRGFISQYKSRVQQMQDLGDQMQKAYDPQGRIARARQRAVGQQAYVSPQAAWAGGPWDPMSAEAMGFVEADMAERAQEEAAKAEGKGQKKRVKQQKKFSGRLMDEITKMGVLRGGLHWRFARAEGGALLKWTAALWIAGQAVSALGKVVKSAFSAIVQYDQQMAALTGFADLASGYGLSATTILSDSKAMSRGLVKDTKVIATANKLLLASQEDLAGAIPQLMERAYGWAPLLGQTVEQTFDQVIKAIQSGNAEALQQFGLLEVGTDALQAYADEWGITVDAMSDAEKQAVLLNAVLSQLPATMTDVSLAVRSTSEEWQSNVEIIKEVLSKKAARDLTKLAEGIAGAIGGEDLFTKHELNLQFADMIAVWERVVRGAELEMPDLNLAEFHADISAAWGEVSGVWEAAEAGAATWDEVGEAVTRFGDTVQEVKGRINLEYQNAQIVELQEEILATNEITSAATQEALALANALLLVWAAAEAGDPSALADVEATLRRMAELAGVIGGYGGFEKETDAARRIRVAKELGETQADYQRKAEQWGLSMAEYWDPKQIIEYVGVFKDKLNVAIEDGLLLLPEWQQELWLEQNILSQYDQLHDDIAEVNKETKRGTGYWKEYNKAILYSAKAGGMGTWAVGFAMEHGGRSPLQAYARHEEPLVAATLDRLWGEKFERKEGRPPTEAEWKAHWYEQWEPLELYPGGPIAKATGGLADMVRDMLENDNLGGLGDVFHDTWMESKNLAPKFKDVMTEAEALADFTNETWLPSIRGNAEAFDLSTATIDDWLAWMEGKISGAEEAKPPDGEGEENGRTYLPIPELQRGGIVRRSGAAIVHAGEVFGSMNRLMETVSMHMGGGGGGGLVIQSLSIPVTVGAGAPATIARDVQSGVVHAIRGRGGTEMKRAARRLGK